MDAELIERGVRLILEGIGEDADREGLRQTPSRVARAFGEICSGMDVDPAELFSVTFEAECHEPVIVKDIGFHSLCEHHLLPFFGVAHVAYVPGPDGKVCGISKLARAVEVCARRLQLQERLTNQVADAIEKSLLPEGVLVVVEAEHMCMTMRGVRKPGAKTLTSAARGTMLEDGALAARTLAMMGIGGAR